MIDLIQRNLNASFSLLRRLAGARNLGEIVELQAAHFSNRFAASIGQSEELATLSIKTALQFVRDAYPAFTNARAVMSAPDRQQRAITFLLDLGLERRQKDITPSIDACKL